MFKLDLTTIDRSRNGIVLSPLKTVKLIKIESNFSGVGNTGKWAPCRI